MSKKCQKVVKVVKKFDPTFVPLNPAGHLWINGQQSQDKYQRPTAHGTKIAENGQIVQNSRKLRHSYQH
jgi:hypothetical protein